MPSRRNTSVYLCTNDDDEANRQKQCSLRATNCLTNLRVATRESGEPKIACREKENSLRFWFSAFSFICAHCFRKVLENNCCYCSCCCWQMLIYIYINRVQTIVLKQCCCCYYFTHDGFWTQKSDVHDGTGQVERRVAGYLEQLVEGRPRQLNGIADLLHIKLFGPEPRVHGQWSARVVNLLHQVYLVLRRRQQLLAGSRRSARRRREVGAEARRARGQRRCLARPRGQLRKYLLCSDCYCCCCRGGRRRRSWRGGSLAAEQVVVVVVVRRRDESARW